MLRKNRFLLATLPFLLFLCISCTSADSKLEENRQSESENTVQSEENSESSTETATSDQESSDASGRGTFSDNHNTENSTENDGVASSSLTVVTEELDEEGNIVRRDSYTLQSDANSSSKDESRSEFGDSTTLEGTSVTNTSRENVQDVVNTSERDSTTKSETEEESSTTAESSSWFGIPWYYFVIVFILVLIAIAIKIFVGMHSRLFRLGTLLSSVDLKAADEDKYKVILNQKDRNYLETLRNK